jgi:anti-sigma regulatory factor (Ser/Thr protein kinase)
MTPAEGDNPGVVVLRWGYNPRAVGQARAELRKVLASWGHAAVEDAAALVLSELLTNVQRHARVPGREIETRFLRLAGDGGVRLEVHDASAQRPLPQQATSDACEGRGLALVDGVADRWGVTERTGPGKSVWAECTQVLR